MLVLGAKKISWLDRLTMGTEIDLIHLFYDTVKTRVFLIFEQIVQFKLFFGQEDSRAFVTNAFENKHRQLVKQWVQHIDIEYDVTKMTDAFFLGLTTSNAFLVGLHDTHAFVIDGIGSCELDVVDLTYGVFNDLFGRIDTKLDKIEFT
jgi:hypothetical protein